jgi:hypothetical protein
MTPWYPANVSPVRNGVYERDLTGTGLSSDVRRYAYWHGGRWYGYAQNPTAALRSYDNGFLSGVQEVGRWRGLRRRTDSRTERT